MARKSHVCMVYWKAAVQKCVLELGVIALLLSSSHVPTFNSTSVPGKHHTLHQPRSHRGLLLPALSWEVVTP
jgi:hypothetical protein